MVLDSKPYSDYLIFDSLIHPAGSKRYVRLNLNMRGKRKIIVGASRKHGCVSGLGCGCGYGCGTRQFLKRVGAGAAGLGD